MNQPCTRTHARTTQIPTSSEWESSSGQPSPSSYTPTHARTTSATVRTVLLVSARTHAHDHITRGENDVLFVRDCSSGGAALCSCTHAKRYDILSVSEHSQPHTIWIVNKQNRQPLTEINSRSGSVSLRPYDATSKEQKALYSREDRRRILII